MGPSGSGVYPSNAQDLELASTLISMKGLSKRKVRRNKSVDKEAICGPPLQKKPHSPTRIDDLSASCPSLYGDNSQVNSEWGTHLTPIFRPMQAAYLYATPSPAPSMHFLHPMPLPQMAAAIAPTPNTSSPAKYTPAQRQDALRRYREKKQRRKNQSNAIRYEVRKRLADTRPRLHGRFFKRKTESLESNCSSGSSEAREEGETSD